MKSRTGKAAGKGYGLSEMGILIIGGCDMFHKLGLVKARGDSRDFT